MYFLKLIHGAQNALGIDNELMSANRLFSAG